MGADVEGMGLAPMQMSAGWAPSRRRCCGGEPSPGADVGRGSPVPMRTLQMRRGEPRPSADVAGVSPVPAQMQQADALPIRKVLCRNVRVLEAENRVADRIEHKPYRLGNRPPIQDDERGETRREAPLDWHERTKERTDGS